MPKISVIIAVYNVEKYLHQCLDSLVNQTLSDIEIICTDDGSTDSSLEILKEYQKHDNRIKIIEQENQGPGVARNNALDIASGKYIMIADPDDWLELNACELAYNQIEQNGNDLVIFDFQKYDDDTGLFIDEGNHFIPFKDYIDNPHINVADLKTNFIQNAFVWHNIYNKEFLKEKDIKFLPFYLGEDAPVSMLSLMQSNDISILNKILYNYRVRSDSASYNMNRWQEHINSKKYVVDYAIKSDLNKSIIQKASNYLFVTIRHWYRVYSKRDSSIKSPYKKEACLILDMVYDYMDYRTKFHYILFKYNLEWLYYKLIRPIGKYCIVLPYRRIRDLLKGNKFER